MFKQKNYTEALKMVKKSENLVENSDLDKMGQEFYSYILSLKARILEAMGRHEAAYETARKGLEIFPKDTSLRIIAMRNPTGRITEKNVDRIAKEISDKIEQESPGFKSRFNRYFAKSKKAADESEQRIRIFDELVKSPLGGPIGQVNHGTLSRKWKLSMEEALEWMEYYVTRGEITIKEHRNWDPLNVDSNDIWIISIPDGAKRIFQSCPSCNNEQSILQRICTNCGEELSNCGICKKGFFVKEQKLSCPNCNQEYHRNHIIGYIQSKGECAICHFSLTTTQFDMH